MSEAFDSTVDRRKFLTVLGVTGGGALALGGCSTDRIEKLVPYLVQSEDQVPGVPTWYASTCTECPAGCGLHVKTREGRPIKLEGNPQHPVNQGKLCARGQAGLQGLYNPSRVKGPMLRDGSGWKDISWDDALARLASEVQKAGSGLRVLSGAGPGTFDDLLESWTAGQGGTVTRWQPFAHEALRVANQRVFGTSRHSRYDVAAARVIVSFGADFLETFLSPVEQQAGYARSHGFSGESARHIHIGPRRDLTGLNADEWLNTVPGTEAAVARAMAGVIGGGAGEWTPERAAEVSGVPADSIRRVAREIASATPALAMAGGVSTEGPQAVELCTAVNELNRAAGAVGSTVFPGEGVAAVGDGAAAMDRLLTEISGGGVSMLLVHDANPVYALPAATKFVEAMARIPFKVSTNLFLDETASRCDLLLPGHHALERWDDLASRPGIQSLMQPTIEPVFNTRHTGDVLLGLQSASGSPPQSFEQYLRAAWQSLAPTDDAWRAALAAGGIYQGAPAAASRGAGELSAVKGRAPQPAALPDGQFALIAFPHPFLYDGRGTNRPWLLENPDPVTKVTWHSWVEISTRTARELDIRRGEIVRLVSEYGAIEGPAFPYSGLHDRAVAVPTGFGHTAYGEFATDRGVNVLDLLGPMRGGVVEYAGVTVRLEKTGRFKDVATTEGNPRQLGRGIAEAMPIAYAKRGMSVKEAHIAEGGGDHEINTPLEVEALSGWREAQVEKRLLGDYATEHPSWGMSIDLSRCIGCSACVTACYAENNVPTVGESQVLKGREMSWMRIERYWEGETEDGETIDARFVPMLCQHCENAPCEPVCPVYAAYHTPDGLNGQVYNRCVGTRYCGNNCPYKVRYFNWYKYNEMAWPEPLHLQLNPDVTVRARGVMEKCTFCIQRIRGAQSTARLEDRPLVDGEFTTACAQACPSDAIVFGNRRDPNSRVSEVSRDPRGYHILEDLNVRPAVTYLAKVLNRTEA